MALNATIDLTVKKPDFKSMKSEIKELTVAAQQAVMQFGAFSPEAAKAEKALAGAKDRMDDFNDRVKAVNPDKFAKLQTVVMGVANGFAAAQGAMALFGNESKDFEKTMVKLQGAMALTQGLEGLGKVQQQFGALAGNIKGNVIKAFQALGKMSTLAFGLLGIAITLIIANFDTLKKAVMSLIPGLGRMVDFVGGLVQKFTDWVGITNAQDRALEKLNKTTGKANEQLDREIALLQARGDQVGVFNKQRQKLDNDLAQARANYGKNNEKEWGKIILDTKNALEILRIQEQNFNKERNKTAAQKEADRLKAIQDAQDLVDAQNKKHEEDLFKELGTIKGAGLFKQGEQLKTYTDEEYILLAAAAARRKALEEKSKADSILSEQQIHDAKLSIAQSTVEGLTALNNILTAEDQKRQNIQKGIALVEIAIDTAIAVSSLNAESAKASAQVAGILGPATPIFTAAYYAQGIVRILANVAKAKQLLSGGKPSGGGGTGAMGVNAPAMSAPNISSSLPSVSGFDTKVFVTEGDIRRTTDRVDSTRKVSVVK